MITAILLVTAISLPSIRTIRVDLDSRALVPRGDPRLAASDRAAEGLGNHDTVVVGITTPTGDVLEPHNLRALRRLTEGLAKTPGIVPGSVKSLATTIVLWPAGGTQHVSPLLGDEIDVRAVRRQIDQLGLADGVLLSRQHDAAAVISDAAPDADRYRLLEELQRLAQSETRGDTEAWVTGTALAQAALGLGAAEDLARLVPIVLLILGVVLTLAFRQATLALIAIAEVGLSLLWTAVVIAWTGGAVVVTMVVLPVVLIVVGISDDIYLIRAYVQQYSRAGGKAVEDVLAESFGRSARAIALTTASTAIGLLSLTLTNLRPLQLFGAYGAVAVLFSGVMAFTLVPALLAMVGSPVRAAAAVGPWRLGAPSRTGAISTAALAGIVGGISLASASGLAVDDSWVRNLPASSPVAQGDAALDERLAGTTVVDFRVTGVDGKSFEEPELLRRLLRAQELLVQTAQAGAARSVVTDLLRVKSALSGRPVADVEADFKRSRSEFEPAQISQLLLVLASTEPAQLEASLAPDLRAARLSVHIPRATYQRIAAVVEAARRLESSTDLGLELRPFGDGWISYFTVDALVADQVRSTVAALFVECLLLSLVFGSLWLGAVAVLPAAMTLMITFGVMGAAAWPLGIANAMFAGIVISIGLDFPIHFLTTYQRVLTRPLSAWVAIRTTLSQVGPAVATSAVSLSLAFLVLLAASTSPTVQLGLVVAFGLATAGVLTLVLLPAVLLLGAGRSNLEEELQPVSQ